MKVNMTIADGRDGFFQYDENAFLLVSGCHEVHFCHSGDDETVVVPVIPHDDSADDLFCPLSFRRHHGHRGATGHVLVPASLLQSSADIGAYGNIAVRVCGDVGLDGAPAAKVAPGKVFR